MQTISAQMKGKTVDSGDSIHLLAPSHSLVSVEQLAKAASLRPESVRKLVDVGLIEPSCQTWSGPLFPRSSLERLRRILRLRHDLGINLAGIAAVLDMRERIESLQREVQRLRQLQFAK
jgi:MerR family transcriptional regulator/heat shock protein HspR